MRDDFDDELEPERYEQWEELAYRFDPSRREFLRVLGGGLLVSALALSTSSSASLGPARSRGAQAARDDAVSAWLRIGPDGIITVYTGKVEVGQDIRTSLAQTVAEELRVGVDRVKMVMGDTDLTPYDRGTHGSQSTPRMGAQLRAVAATARRIIAELAAQRWSVSPEMLVLADGVVRDEEGNRTAPYASLIDGADLAAVVDDDASVRSPAQWTTMGKAIGKTDALAVVTGQQIFVSDISLPGLQHGKVLRAPSMGARLRDVDLSRAQAIPGVTVVRDGDFVGVVAPDPHLAEQALEAIGAIWEEIPQPSAAELFDHLEAHPVEASGRRGPHDETLGTPDKALRTAKTKHRAEYTLPYLAHAPLEPRAAVATWVGDRLLAWTGTQHPFSVRDDLARSFGMSSSAVRVRVPPNGSGFGGKHSSEAALEAARLARAAKTPVKLVWTREEEFWWAYFRPAAVMRLRSGLDSSGTLVGWEHVNINSGTSSLATPYTVANQRTVYRPSASPARQGSYRALASTANTFARESHMDELAALVRADPLEFRRRHLENDRLRAVLDAAAARYDWDGAKSSKQHGRGVAIGTDKGSYVCTCAEVVLGPGGDLDVTRLVTAFECGAIVNPDNLQNQIEGAVIMGLGAALFEAVELDAGKVVNADFARYRVPRFTDIPLLETVLVNRRDLPSEGAGETPIVAVAPAIANAIADATGRRIRSMPLIPTGRLP
jgi:nicotinate dehydrogenase subunit B